MKSQARSARLHTNGATDPDTVWIGHVFGTTGLPGAAGGALPFHIGRGGHRIGTASAAGNNGYWDFDRLNAGEADTLQGWVMAAQPFQSASSNQKPDWFRSMFGLDYGNQGNYRGNSFGKATFGVLGYWHEDNGAVLGATIAGTNPAAPGWATIAGTKSAWCGLRAHGDLTAVDPITLNGFNSNISARTGDNHQVQVGSINPNGTDTNFPGYGDQWDQLLYRDFDVADGASLHVQFKYATSMSLAAITAVGQRIGWFNKDPLQPSNTGGNPGADAADGNFISSTAAGALAPVDSFMVYIGVPTDPDACVYTNTLFPTVTTKKIFDVQRRWFSEVLRIEPQGASVLPYYELLSTSGVNGTTAAPIAFDKTVPNTSGDVTVGTIQPLLDAQAGAGGKIRVVFRVKTNRGGSDEAGNFASGGAGAAIIDDVLIDGTSVGDFESTGQTIDNNTATAATDAWKSTGKPPGVYFHWHNLVTGQGPYSGLPYADPCGAIGAPLRRCNMFGNIITPGDHDNFEKAGGDYQGNFQDHQDWMESPTINLMSNGNGPGFYNDMGIDQEIADATGDISMYLDMYLNLLSFGETGNGVRIGWQTYPAVQANGIKTWYTPIKTISFNGFDGTTGCLNGQNGVIPIGGRGISTGLIRTKNANGVPDSLRAYLEHLSICFRRPITGAQCSPTTGPFVGHYIDNPSFGFIDSPPPAGIANQEWDKWQDTFPTNSSNSFVGVPAFDSLGANIRVGYNAAQTTADLDRNAIPGDTMVVIADGSNIRCDLIFRILPGPGNYFGSVPSGQSKIGQLKRRPDQATAATSGDASFWGKYLADVGLFGTGVAHTAAATMSSVSGEGATANQWDPNVWMSARLDTTELNLFKCDAVGPNDQVAKLTSGSYMSAYHESELSAVARGTGPDYGGARQGLGIDKTRCIFIVVTAGAPNDETNITCTDNALYKNLWNFTYKPNISGIYSDPTCVGCPIGHTKEFTKIIPDGLLTAGAHVEYFYRKSTLGDLSTFEMMPDTTQILQLVEDSGGTFDGHRWAENSVLPDRWKDPNYTSQSSTLACMLVVDYNNMSGDEYTFDQMAGTIGLTVPSRRGANNGYFLNPTEDVASVVGDIAPSQVVSQHLGQAGSLYDIYNVTAGDSNVPAGRLGSRDAATCIGSATGKGSTCGPTKTMLRTFYRHMFVMTGSLKDDIWGPIDDQSDDDIGTFTNFLIDPTGSSTPRTMIVTGRNVVLGQDDAIYAANYEFFPTFFGATIRGDSYRELSFNQNEVADLIPVSPVSTSGTIYGVYDVCLYKNDVYGVNTAVSGAAASVFYENVGGAGPYIAGVSAPAGGTRLANTLVCGWTFGLGGSQGSRYTLSIGGHHLFWLNALTNIIGNVCGQPLSAPVGVENGSAKAFVSFMNLRSENPMRSGEARIAFGLTKSEKVEVKVYDVTGRLVKTVANRVFQGGVEHVVTWNGTNELGSPVSRGVYFYQLRSPSFTSEKKLTVLKD